MSSFNKTQNPYKGSGNSKPSYSKSDATTASSDNGREAPRRPDKRLLVKHGRDAKLEEVAPLWANEDKKGKTYYRGKNKEGEVYYLFARSNGLQIARKEGDKYVDIAMAQKNEKGNFTAAVDNGPLYVIVDNDKEAK